VLRLALTCALVVASPALADTEASRRPRAPLGEVGGQRLEEPRGTSGLTPERAAARAAIERGLRFLAAQQATQGDGSIPSLGSNPARLAVTALGALAYMAAGSTPGRGPHGPELARAIDHLLAHTDLDTTSQQRGYIHDAADKNSKLHAHGFAALALAEAYAMSPREGRGLRIAESLQAAIDLMEASQTREGGWYYAPVRGIEHEGSVTIALVQAMRAAKNAGLRVDPEVIARAVDYVRRSQTDTGAFRYALGSDEVSVALTAAAIATLNATGRYHGPEIRQGFDYIERELRLREEAAAGATKLRPREGQAQFPCYERLYLAQAFWQSPDPSAFERWFEAEEADLLRTQREDGSWDDPRFGPTYATAVNVLVLALPDQLLPIFQR
jgi:hypothetical protein